MQGGLGVCVVIAGTAAGAIVTMVTGSEPGAALGVFVVAGTIAAALAVRPSAGRLIIPVPVLSYLVAALATGIIHNRSAGSSGTALAIGAAQWIANGFFAMALATSLAIVIIAVRWYLSRRSRPADPGWTAPAPDRPQRPPASREPVGTLGSRGGPRAGPGATGPNRPAQPPATQPRATLPPGTLPPGTLPPAPGAGRTGPQPPPRGRVSDPYRPLGDAPAAEQAPRAYNFSSGA